MSERPWRRRCPHCEKEIKLDVTLKPATDLAALSEKTKAANAKRGRVSKTLIIQLHREGVSAAKIAETVGCSAVYVGQVVAESKALARDLESP